MSWIIIQTMLWSIVWYLWIVRRGYIQHMSEVLTDTFEYHAFLLKESYWLKLVTSFVAVLSVSDFVVKTWNLIQYIKYSGLPHVY